MLPDSGLIATTRTPSIGPLSRGLATPGGGFVSDPMATPAGTVKLPESPTVAVTPVTCTSATSSGGKPFGGGPKRRLPDTPTGTDWSAAAGDALTTANPAVSRRPLSVAPRRMLVRCTVEP